MILETALRPLCRLLAAAALFVPNVALAQVDLTQDRTPDPDAAVFVYDDLHNFLEAYQELASGEDSVAILDRGYFRPATPGLLMFVEKYDLTAERLARAIQKHPDAYTRLAETVAALEENEPSYRQDYRRLKGVIKDAEFPPTYFLVGAHRGIGSGSAEGPLVTIEKNTARSVREDPNTLLVHEMVHLQQVRHIGLDKYLAIYGDERTLLAMCVREGIAEFFTSLVTGEITQKEALAFVHKHEGELWKQFRRDMLGEETGDWMWSQPADPEQPQHVGYAVGARIVEAYYARYDGSDDAIREILAVTDYEGFLERSGYAERFAGQQ